MNVMKIRLRSTLILTKSRDALSHDEKSDTVFRFTTATLIRTRCCIAVRHGRSRRHQEREYAAWTTECIYRRECLLGITRDAHLNARTLANKQVCPLNTDRWPIWYPRSNTRDPHDAVIQYVGVFGSPLIGRAVYLRDHGESRVRENRLLNCETVLFFI